MTTAAEQFEALARKQLAKALALLPSDRLQRHALLIEFVRVVDYWAVFQRLLPEDKRLSPPDFQIVQWGWNVGVGHILEPLAEVGGFPLTQSTRESQSFALNVLHQFGRFVLMRRTSEMLKYGFVEAREVGGAYVVRTVADAAADQHLDVLEFSRLKRLEHSLWGSGPPGWARRWMRRDIEDLMAPLVRPWDTGYGVMLNYGALPEIDDHYVALALELASEWCSEAGIHPDTSFGGITGADLIGIGTVIVGLHAKHVAFTLVGSRRYPEISIPQSLTIWSNREELEQSIAQVTNVDQSLVSKTIDVLALRPADMPRLREHTTPFRPLLIDLGNGLVLRPISCLDGNVFNAARTLVEWRNPSARAALSEPREEWMRRDLYGLFQGNRYECVHGSVKIREGGRTVTDIDGAVFDRQSGDVALFQFKWQDLSTNDVRTLRSKASNFAREVDDWAEKVGEWAGRVGIQEVLKTFRLQVRKDGVGKVFLFGVSRIGARLQAYGFTSSSKSLALANWPHFVASVTKSDPRMKFSRRCTIGSGQKWRRP